MELMGTLWSSRDSAVRATADRMLCRSDTQEPLALEDEDRLRISGLRVKVKRSLTGIDDVQAAARLAITGSSTERANRSA